eukprot:GFYU01009631.1.p1 GENE.GFYU01009631.1~~GFYU01009631.1.p1  ORF type:complete len:411 (-),score=77.49 GFYU01009631.1:196-1344(-)
MSAQKEKDKILCGSDLVKERWQIMRSIGQGGFGEIYSAADIETGDAVAIKMERPDAKSALKLEVSVLRRLQVLPQCARFLASGRWEGYNFLVMELLGDNLSELRRQMPDGRFSLATTLRLGMQMVRCIEGIHGLGYLHRDIKPSNFAMGLGPKARQLYVIDFGLARKYVLPNGEVRPPRDQAGFRGTARYASINSHRLAELGRRDDLWSLFYLLVEFMVGSLPWRKIKEKEEIGVMKEKYANDKLVQGLPEEFAQILEHVVGLEYKDAPNYDYIYSRMYSLYKREGYTEDTPYDWEVRDDGKGDSSASPRSRRTSSFADQATGHTPLTNLGSSFGSLKEGGESLGSPAGSRRSVKQGKDLRHIVAARRSSSPGPNQKGDREP